MTQLSFLYPFVHPRKPQVTTSASEEVANPEGHVHQCSKAVPRCCIEYHVRDILEGPDNDAANNLLWGHLIGSSVNKMSQRNQLLVKYDVEDIIFLALREENQSNEGGHC